MLATPRAADRQRRDALVAVDEHGSCCRSIRLSLWRTSSTAIA
jgi:hypothetical protein